MKLNISDLCYMDTNIWKHSPVYVNLDDIIDSHILIGLVDSVIRYFISSSPDRFLHILEHIDSECNEVN